RAVHDTAHDSHVHAFDTRVTGLPERHLTTQIRLDTVGKFLEEGTAGTATPRTGDHHGGESPQTHALQDLLCNHDFLAAVATRLGGERDAYRVADAFLQQHGQCGRGGNDAL